MDTEIGVDHLTEVENLSHNSMKNLEKNHVVVEAKDNVTDLPPPSTAAADRAASVGPITPDSNKETGDFLFGFTSPLSLVSSAQKDVYFDSDPNDILRSSSNIGPHTPVEGVFDPFAPGPEKLMLAPRCKKYLEESRSNVARRLKFDSSVSLVRDGNCETDAVTISDDEMLLETVYDTLLEAIVSKQTEGFLAEISNLDPGSDGFRTPDSTARLSGIAETCPGAPMKPEGTTRRLRNIDQGLCRKLEF